MSEEGIRVELENQKETLRKFENLVSFQHKEQNDKIKDLTTDVKNHTEQILNLTVQPINNDISEIKESLKEHIRRTELNEQHIKMVEEEYNTNYKLKNQSLTRLSIIIPSIIGALTIITQLLINIFNIK